MYFNASERIALRTTYPRSSIEKVDEFLAGPDIKRFELRQAEENTNFMPNVLPILQEYVRENILKEELTYLCPEDGIRLKANRNRVGECDICGKSYPLDDCPTKLLYERIREPDVLIANTLKHQNVGTNSERSTSTSLVRKILKFLGATIVAILIGVIGSVIASYIYQSLSSTSTQNIIATKLPSADSVPTFESSPEPNAIPNNSFNTTPTVLPSSENIHPKLTLEVATEQTVRPTDDP